MATVLNWSETSPSKVAGGDSLQAWSVHPPLLSMSSIGYGEAYEQQEVLPEHKILPASWPVAIVPAGAPAFHKIFGISHSPADKVELSDWNSS